MIDEDKSVYSRVNDRSLDQDPKNKQNMDMMFLKRLFHLQTELNKVTEEKNKHSDFRNTDRSNEMSVVHSPPNVTSLKFNEKLAPRLNLALFNYNPKFKHDNIDTVRKGARSRRKYKHIRMDSQQSHMPTNKLEPLINRNFGKKSIDHKLDSSEERNRYEQITLTGNRIAKKGELDTSKHLAKAAQNLTINVSDSRSNNSKVLNGSYLSHSFKDDSKTAKNNTLMADSINKHKYMTSIDQDNMKKQEKLNLDKNQKAILNEDQSVEDYLYAGDSHMQLNLEHQ